jgi:hypothetical protein
MTTVKAMEILSIVVVVAGCLLGDVRFLDAIWVGRDGLTERALSAV